MLALDRAGLSDEAVELAEMAEKLWTADADVVPAIVRIYWEAETQKPQWAPARNAWTPDRTA